MKQLGLWTVLGIWAAVCLGGALFASWQGYSGRAFAATLSAFAFFLLVMLVFAARGVSDRLSGPAAAMLLGVLVLLVYLAYLLGTSAFTFLRISAMAGLIFVPLGVATSAEGATPGAWQDFLIVAGLWVFVKFGPTHELWPYPGGRLAYVFAVLAAVNVAVAVFLLMRHIKGIGYSIGWGKRWGLQVVGSFVVFGCFAIPLGLAMRFLAYEPQWKSWNSLAFTAVGIFLFTAWPEELLFRGLLQNLLARASKSELAGWWTASMLFGFSHITNMGFPNWRYVILAAIAGLFYGWTWRKTGSIFASALVHAAVDVTWHFLFTTHYSPGIPNIR
jgi:uncharacterized protein